jgi:hypothetical protein
LLVKWEEEEMNGESQVRVASCDSAALGATERFGA